MYLVPIAALFLAAGVFLRDPVPGLVLIVPAVLVPRLATLRVPALALLAGALLPVAPAPSRLLAALPGDAPLVRLTGTVRRGPDLPVAGSARLVLDVERVGGRAVPGRVLVFLPDLAPLPSPGARITVTGRLERPRRSANPGEADPRERLARRGISHLMRIRATGSLRVLRPAPALSPGRLLHRARLALSRRIDALPDRRTGAVLSALLLGRRDRVPDRLAEDFRRSGTSHFLAISGLHVGILAGLVWLLLRPAPLPRSLAALLVAAVALAYAALTGLRPPALRAALLVLLVAGGVAVRRKPRPLHLLAAAAIVVLAADPGAISRAGFQLSFAAVLAILTLSRPMEDGLFARWKLLERFSVPREQRVRRALRRYATKSVPVSLAAWFGTAPILLVRFGTLPLLVVPANLLAFPIVFSLIPAGLLAAATGFSLPADLLVTALSSLVHLLAGVPGACPVLPAPPLPIVLAYAAGLVFLARRQTLGAGAVAAALLALGLLAASGSLLRRAPAEPRLTVLSVGPGLSAVLETPEGGVLVYDVGSRRPRIFDRVVLPWLRHRRIFRPDLVVLSHDDSDHTSGAGPLVRAMPVAAFHPPGTLRAGDRPPLPGASVEVLWPPPGAARPLSENDGSTVLRVRAGALRVLLPGDLEENGIRGLLATGRDLRADVLVLPHHGRPTGMADALVRAVGARVLVASCGPDDPMDPAYAGAIRTSERGAVTVTAGGDVATFR